MTLLRTSVLVTGALMVLGLVTGWLYVWLLTFFGMGASTILVAYAPPRQPPAGSSIYEQLLWERGIDRP